MDSSAYERLGSVLDDFLDRLRDGEQPEIEEYVRRHPDLSSEIHSVFPALAAVQDLEPTSEDVEAPAAIAPLPKLAPLPEMAPLPELEDYTIIREIGRGGMGIVYEAIDCKLFRHVALKVLPHFAALDPDRTERFLRESRAAARLHHTNIVPVYGVGVHDGVHYYAMQYIRGTGLDQWIYRSTGRADTLIARRDPLTRVAPSASESLETDVAPPGPSAGTSTRIQPALEVARIGIQVADALAHAHAQGILHRDIKPANLLVDADGLVWVTDFGLARAADEAALTKSCEVVGTVQYMAPERLATRGDDERGDIYSLGLTLYEAATLRPAFESDDHAVLLRKVLHETPPRPRSLNPSIPRDLETIILKAIQREPAARYVSCNEMLGDLRRFVDGRPINARRTSAAELVWKWCRRNPRTTALSMALAGVVLLIASVSPMVAVQYRRLLHEAQENVLQSTTAMATANRHSPYVGRRVDALRNLQRASDVAQQLGSGPDTLQELRQAAIDIMTVSDVEPTAELFLGDVKPSAAAKRPMRGFDNTLSRIAVRDAQGNLQILAIPSGNVEQRLPCEWDMRPEMSEPWTEFSPDGRHLAIRGRPRGSLTQLEWWNLQTSKRHPQRRVNGYFDQQNFRFAPDGKHLAYVNSDTGQVEIVHLTTNEICKRFPCDLENTWLCYSPNSRYLLMGGGKSIDVMDVVAEKLASARFPHPDAVLAAAWRHDGQRIVTGCSNGNAYIWEFRAPDVPYQTCKGHANPVQHVMFHPDGHCVVSTASDGTSRIWNPESGDAMLRMDAAASRFSRDGRWLGYESGQRVGRWRFHRSFYRQLNTRSQRNDRVVSIAFAPDGRRVAWGTEHRGVTVWDFEQHRGDRLDGFLSQTRSVAFHPASGDLYCSGDPSVVRVPLDAFPGEDFEFTEAVPVFESQDAKLELTTLGNRLGIAGDGNVFHLLDGDGGLRHLEIGQTIDSLAASPDGRLMATIPNHSSKVTIRDARSGRRIREVETTTETGGANARFSPNSRLLAVTYLGHVAVFETNTWTRRLLIPLKNQVVGRAAFSCQGDLLAVTNHDHVLLIRTRDLQTVARLNSPHREILAGRFASEAGDIAFGPDDRRLIVGTHSAAVQMWEIGRIRDQLHVLGLPW